MYQTRQPARGGSGMIIDDLALVPIGLAARLFRLGALYKGAI